MNGFLHSPATLLLEPRNGHRKDGDGPFSHLSITEQVSSGTPGESSLTGQLKQIIYLLF